MLLIAVAIAVLLVSLIAVGAVHGPKPYEGRHRAPGPPLRGGKWS